MPAIHSESLLTLVKSVGLNDLRQAGIGRREYAVLSRRMLKIPGATKIVLCSCSTNSGPFNITIQVKFDFTFAPPAIVAHAPGEISANVLSLTPNPVDDRMNPFVRYRVGAPPLRVKIGPVFRNLRQRVSNLVIETGHRICAQIFQRNECAFAKRHFPVAIECACRVHRHRQRSDIAAHTPTVAEKISQWHLDGRGFLAIPEKPDHKPSPSLRMDC